MKLEEILWYCFLHFYHLDCSNAPIHTAEPRFSPITFRLCEEIWANHESYRVNDDLRRVWLDRKQYQEDTGR